MALNVKWSSDAEDTYDQVIFYLLRNWTARDADKFEERVSAVISNISKNPYIFKSISIKKIRKATVTKHNSLYYFIRKDEIVLAYFWDNRQDPKKTSWDN